jgi:hypothetical protein
MMSFGNAIFESLAVEYKIKYGDCLVPACYPENKNIGTLVGSRSAPKQGGLSRKSCEIGLTMLVLSWIFSLMFGKKDTLSLEQIQGLLSPAALS